MTPPRRQPGFSLVLAAVATFAAAAALVFVHAGVAALAAGRDRATERALAQAREALLAFASERPITATVGPGYLPCPDIDNDGWAEGICGSLSGDRGQRERLGRLPWKTLGLADLRDGHGERLWYAVSTRHKGLLNCAASAACVDLSPATAHGTITLRDPAGRVLHDGTRADAEAGGAAAVVFAPGPPLARLASRVLPAREQRRGCAPPDCDAQARCLAEPPQAAPACDAANYLDAAPASRSGEDNAAFHDRTDAARPRNTDGFIQGPVVEDGTTVVNDRLAAITYAELMPRVMRRVAVEVAQCLDFYGSRPENGGRLPAPSPACASAALGPVPDTPFVATAGMLPRWWRSARRDPESPADLPTRTQACRIAMPPADDGPARTAPAGTPSTEGSTAGLEEPAWWRYWRPFVLYAPAAGVRPEASPVGCAQPGRCLELVDPAGRRLGGERRFALVVGTRAHACTTSRLQCEASACRRVRADPAPGSKHEFALAQP